MTRRSHALRDFHSSIAIAERLMKREQRFPDPPTPRSFKEVQGLRGGATVLMVAAFENYLKYVVEEKLDKFTRYPLQFNPGNLPEEMIYHNFYQTLHRSIHGPFDEKGKTYKIIGFQQASQIVIKGVINPPVFSEVARSNPNSTRVKDLFKSMGLPDIYQKIKPEFDRQWGTPTANTFIQDTLDYILDRRHEVAHTATALNVSRVDLKNWVKFLKLISNLCDVELGNHIQTIRR